MGLTKAKNRMMDLTPSDSTDNTVLGIGADLVAEAAGGNTSGCTVVGKNSMVQNKNAQNCVTVGQDSSRNMSFDIGTTGIAYNTAVGNGCMYVKKDGSNNTAVGADAFGSFKDDADRAIGDATGVYNDWAGNVNTGGSYCTAIGQNAITYTSGDNNTAVGQSTGVYATTGDNNTYLGKSAGAKGSPSASSEFLMAGSNNTFIGYQASPTYIVRNADNMTALGAGALVSTANTVVLGSTTDNVVIGRSNNITSSSTHANAKLQIEGGVSFYNTDTAGSNTLGWYEEKEFTPGSTGIAIVGGTGLVLTGKATRIGNSVTGTITVYNPGGTHAATSATLTGLPYSSTSQGSCITVALSTSTYIGTGATVTTTAYPGTWAATGSLYTVTFNYLVH
jgi:hypothetical protein